jgi:hypothetical protein
MGTYKQKKNTVLQIKLNTDRDKIVHCINILLRSRLFNETLDFAVRHSVRQVSWNWHVIKLSFFIEALIGSTFHC